MIDKLQKIIEIEPEMFNYNYRPLPYIEDAPWLQIGRLIDDLQKHYKDKNYAIAIEIDSDSNASFAIGYSGTKYADTLLEAACDAWLALKGGE